MTNRPLLRPRCWPAVFQPRAALLAAVMILAAGCNPPDAPKGGRKDTKRPDLPARSVQSALAEQRLVERLAAVIGTLAAIDQATLSVKVPGRIDTISVDLGSPVKQGDLIAQTDPTDYELRVKQSDAMLAQARARLGLPLQGSDDTMNPAETSTVRQARAAKLEAQKQRDRIRELQRQGISSKSDLELAETNCDIFENRYLEALEDISQRQALLQQRRAELDIARQQLADTRLIAPFSGVIQERRASAGEFLNAASPIVTLVRVDPLRLRVDVPERSAPGVRLGQRVRLNIEGDTNHYAGTISRLSPAITEQSRMLQVEADIANPGSLRPGTFVRADIIIAPNDPATVVPKEALVTFAGIEKVFLIVEGRAVERNVRVGRRLGESVEIISGVKPGDAVVLNPGSLQSGQAVTLDPIAKPKSAPTPKKEKGKKSPGPEKPSTGP